MVDMLQFKPDWEIVKKRLESLWFCENDRACMAVTCLKDNHHYVRETPPADPEALFSYFTDADWIHRRQMHLFENLFFGGEALPVVFMNFGTAGHAKYFKGCKFRFTENTVWYDRSLGDDELPQYMGEEGMLAVEKRCMEKLSHLAQGIYMVSMPDNCGILDALSHLRGSNQLLTDLIDRPDWVLKSIDKILEGHLHSSTLLFDTIRENNLGGSSHGWMHTWTAGRHQQLQVDFSVMISPQMFEKFAMPELIRLTEWLDRSIYHLDGQEQIRHLDMILSLKRLNMIQWTPVAGQPPTHAFIPVLQRIQAAGKGLVLFPQKDEVPKLLQSLKPQGLYLIVNDAKNESEARDLLALVGACL